MNEIEAVVTDSNGKVVHSLFGKWNESVFKGDPPSATCIWRASEWLVPGNVSLSAFPRPQFNRNTQLHLTWQLLICMCVYVDPMPVDQEQYYGFTQFAVELNELGSTVRPLLPPTDTRLRPDQRLALSTMLISVCPSTNIIPNLYRNVILNKFSYCYLIILMTCADDPVAYIDLKLPKLFFGPNNLHRN